jgi:hypothetical protein
MAQLPPTVASVATATKVNAIPTSRGSPERVNRWSIPAKTNGMTGRMQGLTIVSTPARYDNRISINFDYSMIPTIVR